MPESSDLEPDGRVAPGEPGKPPPPPPPGPESHWQWWHTAGLILSVAFYVWMAYNSPLGMFGSWIVVMAVLVVSVLLIGHGIRDVWFGAFIDERNKMSLSRFQMLTWTIIVVSAYATIAVTRARIVGGDPTTALDVTVPQALWALMGISTASLVASPLIKSTKAQGRLGLASESVEQRLREQGDDPKQLQVAGQIVYNRDIRKASFADLFMGEEVANVTHLDLAKIQMFFFTLLVVFTYSIAIGYLLRQATVPPGLPEVSEGMVVLLGISHSGYLVNKALPTPEPPKG